MKFFITGADGLLGSNLVRDVLGAGHEVKALILPGIKTPTLEGLPMERLEGNLLDGGLDLAGLMNGCDGVFHCAAITDMWASPEITWKVNLEATERVVDSCLAAGAGRLVFVGSASSFEPGSIEKPAGETSGFPEGYKGVAYMESKHKAAELVRKAVREKDLDAVIVTPTFLLGPYDSRPSGGELIRQFIVKGLTVTSPGGRNFAYAPDVSKAAFAAWEKGRKGETYILGGHNLTYMDFFTRVAKVVGTAAPSRIMPAPALRLAGEAASAYEKVSGKKAVLNRVMAKLAAMGTYYDSGKAMKELGMTHAPVETAIEESVKSLLEYGHLEFSGTDYFKGKVALVTGASRGVGFAAARALSLRGARVVMTARGRERLEDSKQKLKRLGRDVVAVTGDVGDYKDAAAMVETAISNYGRLDVVINNAGVSMRGHFIELSPEVCQRVGRTNYDGCVNVSKAAISHLAEAKGHLVFISSIAGIFGLPGASVYCATKKALTGLTESLRLELLPKGMHVGIVYLGFTEHDPEKRILAADGSLVLPDRPAHHGQAQAADQIVNMLLKRKARLIMTPVGKLGATVYRISPTFLERAVLFAQSSRMGIFKRFS